MKSVQPPSLGSSFPKRRALAGLISLACLAAFDAQAGGTISFGEDKSITIGLGMRSSLTFSSNGAANGGSSTDFNLDSIRLFTSASLNKYIKGTFNAEKSSDNSVQVMDAIAQFEFSDGFNVWAGRMLPPSDRANLDGPYYLSNWYYPGVVSQYPAKFAGRDDGLTVWGKLADKKLVYSVGAFQGHNRISGASNDSGKLLYAGRLQYNFWDAEPDPAYYTSSTYYGGAEVLALAIAGQFEKDGVGTSTSKGDYKAWSADALMEHKFGDAGSLNLEGGYYKYDTNNVTDVATTFGGASATSNVGGITQGKGWLAGAAYLLPSKVGWGKFQPNVRYQEFKANLTHVTKKQSDYGVNYIIDGHNARISATYTTNEQTAVKNAHKFVVGLQLQF